jgi:predicted transglutaminase-like cysteine proteinase
VARSLRGMSCWKFTNLPFLPAVSTAVLALSAPATAATIPPGLSSASPAACGALVKADGSMNGPERPRTLKADAILGGAPSALERIRMAQAAAEMSGVDTASLAQVPAASSSNGATCAVGDWSQARSALQAAELVATLHPALPVAPRADVFLAAPRIAIGKTRFDADWARVESGHLSAGAIKRSMGNPETDQLALIQQVNRWANRKIAYRADSTRSHGGDYWADAARTLRKGAGDCEDIAIVKYQALLSLGIDRGDLYFTLAHDLVRHADHALLVVKHDGQYFLLDNATDALLDGSQPNDYRPILSFGEGKWIHGIQAASPAIYLSRNELSSPRVMGLIK